MKIVMGLGNPGRRYALTRHNVGFMVVDRLAGLGNVKLQDEKHRSLVGWWHWCGEDVLLVKPQSYMNRSGEALRDILCALPVTEEDLVVIHDDLDLPLGRLRLRVRGGAGGHRGVLSILEVLGHQNFTRVRAGIGRPPAGTDPTDYVLSAFSAEEKPLAATLLTKASEAVQRLLEAGPLKAMQEFNQIN